MMFSMRFLSSLLIILGLFFAGQAPAQLSCHQGQREARSRLIVAASFGEMVLMTPEGYRGIYLGGPDLELFRTFYFKTWSQVEEFYKRVSDEERHFISTMIAQAQRSSVRAHAKLASVAKHEGAELTYRLKGLASLKEKIVDRIDHFPKETGREFSLMDLADVMGFRMVTSFSSKLLKLQTKSEWAQVLDLPESSILEIEFKGTEEHVLNGRFYTATHLKVRGEDRQVFELQVMTRAMEIWHKWDHPNVYKSHFGENPADVKNLKSYSAAWAKLIHDLTPYADRRARAQALSELAESYGLRFYSGFRETIAALDQVFRARWSIDTGRGFSKDELRKLIEALSEG